MAVGLPAPVLRCEGPRCRFGVVALAVGIDRMRNGADGIAGPESITAV